MNRRQRIGVALLVLVPVTVVVAMVAYSEVAERTAQIPEKPPEEVDEDPRATYPTHFRNVRPGVPYAGDAACRTCHNGLCESYANHPMGRSMAVATLPSESAFAAVVGGMGIATGRPEGIERFAPSAHPVYEKFGLRYGAEVRDGRLVHTETGLDAAGKVTTEIAQPMGFAIGSGTHARSYLFERDGFVFQSPVSWYTEPARWDGSPGYQPNWHFNRPAPGECLFCHANSVEPVPGTINGFVAPVFRGPAIGCERCHGPGSLHVSRWQGPNPPTEPDDTIVNPGKLEPSLREAVCQQCHLAGRVRVLRRGRELFDYRPGLPLHLFWSVYVYPSDLGGTVARVAGHTEQMHASRCFQGSGEKLGCISCHDPHRKPTPSEAGATYRTACMKCHTAASCSLPRPERLLTEPADNCAACHMPRAPTPGIGHVALTDHRIPRRTSGAPAPRPPLALMGRGTLVHFHQKLIAPDDARYDRDLGVGLMTLAQLRGGDRGRLPAQIHLSNAALPLLTDALDRHPRDATARDRRVSALVLLGRREDAANEMRIALEHEPRREYTLLEAIGMAEDAGQKDAALRHAERAAEVNPVSAEILTLLCRLRGENGNWAGAVIAATSALGLDPTNTDARRTRIQGLLRTGRRPEAATDYQLLTRTTRDPNELREWYTAQGGMP